MLFECTKTAACPAYPGEDDLEVMLNLMFTITYGQEGKKENVTGWAKELRA
jgi:hypothetical protein